MESGINVAPQLLSPDNLTTLLNHTDAFLFDCDGVIWKGDKLIDGVPETLDMLRSRGKKLVFVTNNSSKSRKKYSEKFQKLGLTVSEDEIFCSSFVAAMYLKSINFPREKKVYVIGHEGILEELQLASFTGLGGPVNRMQLSASVRILDAFSLPPIVMLLVISPIYKNGQVRDAWSLPYAGQQKESPLLLENPRPL